ncbi:ABC transporter ATP-binding protein [Mycolicibacterium celeriflavum]|uniref:Multidrug ABC transporter ATP-binding protein n=1 Tax=Mycolicibacterium celeriflavum TaxID=1249101 RepID=A0A1X0BVA0_MYCCF|nr:ABC transporter ATP-binding protein [Mycolicibacterium celeriflavum]MCV7240585.1 ABC transporter ATP-binding protein [Mycolicibacterium celeriflavum]ORA48068.1 multidrug ABC transporter ATP-binding protein [Mycolicibacterium celeriflavum]BBY43432.1 multidrug ABC transporter ATP-binding protein [Mycolicibacterium celeriflavum]
MIEVSDLDKRFGSCRAVSDVTASFPSATVTALLGLNGAGKTTLLRLIAGLDRPDRGTVTVCGRNPRDEAQPARLLSAHLGPEAMDPRHTVGRHLAWLAALGGIGSERVDAVMSEAGLYAHRDERIVKLSLGFRQRLAIAAALLSDPAAVIFDEPLNGLDVPGIVWLRTLLRRLAADGRTVVLATHLLSEVVLTADRLLILNRGRVAVEGTLDELVPAAHDPRLWLEQALLSHSPALEEAHP